MAKIVFKVTLTVAPVPKGMGFSADNWAQGMKNSVENRRKALWTEIRKDRASLNALALSKDITRAELLKEPIFARMQENKRKSWRKQFQALTEKFPDGSTKHSRGVDSGKENYKRSMLLYRYPLYGSEENKGLIPLARMALTGDQGLKECLKPDLDEIHTGDPIRICPPEKLAEFGKAVSHQMNESGTIIIQSGLTGNDINAQTVRLNRLIESYRSQGIEAQVDFIVRELPEPDNPGRTRKLLSLHIQVSKKD